MNYIDILDYSITINGKELIFPLSQEELTNTLGDARIEKHDKNTYYIYDELGIVFESSEGCLLWLKREKAFKDFAHNITSLDVFVLGEAAFDVNVPAPHNDYVGNITFFGRQVEHKLFNGFMGCYQEMIKDSQGRYDSAHVGAYIGGDDKDANYDGEKMLKPVCISFKPRRPKNTEDYTITPPDEECLVFDNYNFKLAIINELMYKQEIIKPYFDIYDYKEFKKAHWKLETDKNVRAAVQFFKDLPIPASFAERIETIDMDGGNNIYLNIAPMWDGEDERFDIDKISERELKQFTNLKHMTLMTSRMEKIKKICEPLGIDVEEM
jgi:hypothetical protein